MTEKLTPEWIVVESTTVPEMINLIRRYGEQEHGAALEEAAQWLQRRARTWRGEAKRMPETVDKLRAHKIVEVLEHEAAEIRALMEKQRETDDH